MENNLYFLDCSQLRTHLYELWYEYKHNAYQNYDHSDSNYVVDEKKWLHNMRRLEFLVQKYAFGDYNIAEDPASQMIREEEKKMNLDMIAHLQDESKSDNEKACINAIKSLFETADELEFLNKRAVFVYLREISGLTPKQLTTTISNLKKKYRALKEKDEFRIFFE